MTQLSTANQLAKAVRIAAASQENTLDNGGEPYILHSLAVMEGLGPNADHEEKAMAVLHDVLEDDLEWTEQRLREEGFSERILIALRCLTHPVHEPYEDYIKRVASNPDAIKVKMSDLTHNMAMHRLKGIRPKDLQRMEKYVKAYAFLKEVLQAHKKVYP